MVCGEADPGYDHFTEGEMHHYVFRHRTILQSNRLTCNQTQREILSPPGRQARWEHLLLLGGVMWGRNQSRGGV